MISRSKLIHEKGIIAPNYKVELEKLAKYYPTYKVDPIDLEAKKRKTMYLTLIKQKGGNPVDFFKPLLKVDFELKLHLKSKPSSGNIST